MDPVIIRPSRGWSWPRFRELWRSRELLFFMAWRDVKIRYKQTVLGAAWALLHPFLIMVVFAILVRVVARAGTEGLPYPIFAYAALVPWTLFSQSLVGASNSLVGGAVLISKTYFPRTIMPIATVGSYLFDFAIALVLLFGMMAFYGIAPSASAVWIPAFTLLAVLTALAVGIWLAALTARYRDIRFIVPFFVQFWLLASPVLYSRSEIPEAWRAIYALNPMAGVAEGFRWALLGAAAPQVTPLLVSTVATLVVFLLGLSYFQKVERVLADVI
jgi:lipopolysaccharide transport system permease protein